MAGAILGYTEDMRSRNAEFLKREVLEANRRMTRSERVRAFIEHSRILIEIHKAGEARRKVLADRKSNLR